MTHLDTTTTMTPLHGGPVDTGAMPEDSMAITQADRDAWRIFIDEKLIEWGRNSAALEEDDFIPPTQKAVDVACYVAISMRDNGCPPPKRVVPDGDGGIVLERWIGSDSTAFEVSDDGTVEFVQCDNNNVILRQRII